MALEISVGDEDGIFVEVKYLSFIEQLYRYPDGACHYVCREKDMNFEGNSTGAISILGCSSFERIFEIKRFFHANGDQSFHRATLVCNLRNEAFPMQEPITKALILNKIQISPT